MFKYRPTRASPSLSILLLQVLVVVLARARQLQQEGGRAAEVVALPQLEQPAAEELQLGEGDRRGELLEQADGQQVASLQQPAESEPGSGTGGEQQVAVVQEAEGGTREQAVGGGGAAEDGGSSDQPGAAKAAEAAKLDGVQDVIEGGVQRVAAAEGTADPEPFTVAVPQGPEAYVAICAAVKDQHIDVREWIFYHRAIGINKFYLTDTGSKPAMQSVLEDYIAGGLVEYTYDSRVPPRAGTHGPQVTIYERCLQQHGHKHTFMAFIDVDEFLILRDGTPDMPALLKDYEQYGGLVVNWVMFGSSGVQSRPTGNTLMSYWKCAPEQHPENCHVKSIVRPPRVNDSTTDPHHFKYTDPFYAVNTRYEKVKGPKSANVTLDRVGLYHYSIKSMEDFKLKMARGSGMGNQKTIDYLYYIDNFTTADCFDAIDVGVQLASFAVY